jgi:hypothetical protein
MDLRTPEGLEVFHAIIPLVKLATQGSSIDCLYLAGNPTAKDLKKKLWYAHLHGDGTFSSAEGTWSALLKSLMDSFDYEASLVADQSTFDESTWTVTTQFANFDDFLDRVEAELGLNDDDDPSLDGSLEGTPCSKTSFKISADAKASLASALNDPDMDLAANSHASAKSWRTNFHCQPATLPTDPSIQNNLQSPTSLVPLNWQWRRNKRLSWISKTRIWPVAFKNSKQC